jgi:CheY-like chemotaxis protein
MPCVLIVEDDHDVREMLAMLLRQESYEVMTATNGAEALNLMRHRRPCLVLLDLMMPVMNGWDFRRFQIADPALADIPVICLTAVFDPARVAEELNVQCFRKPVALDDVLHVVANACVPRP